MVSSTASKSPSPSTRICAMYIPTTARRLRRQGNQLRRFGVAVRTVDQRRGNTERTLLHRLVHKRSHLHELSGRGLDVALAEHIDADRSRTDERSNVRRDAALLSSVR